MRRYRHLDSKSNCSGTKLNFCSHRQHIQNLRQREGLTQTTKLLSIWNYAKCVSDFTVFPNFPGKINLPKSLDFNNFDQNFVVEFTQVRNNFLFE